ncbi:PAS domain-containing protein [Psychromonas sp.]|uniref:PAS domain-containing protein n=1 Tax=Psychromonas sp. TaxID=1884585 RepID=UPI003567F021
MSEKPSYAMLENKIARLEAKLALFETLKEEQKVNHAFLKILFDIIPSPMFYKDINGVYQYCNDAFSKTILGIPKEEITGKSLYDLPDIIPQKNADIYYQKDAELLKTVTQQSYETKVKCADGIERDYHFYKSTLVVDNQILGLVGVMLDVSQYKNTLSELDKINTALNKVSITDRLTRL